MKIKTRRINQGDIKWIKRVFKKRWSSDFIITHGKIHRPERLDGFIAETNKKKQGLITFKITKKKMEIISLDSFLKQKGIGGILLKNTVSLAKKKGIKRISLITTNDNISALKFYQKRKFNLIKVFPDSIKRSRKIKPGIPLIGNNGIPLRDELELERIL